MFLHTLQLKFFRNYPEQLVKFTAPKTIILGNNAQGKSNLLEAVELLATLKSHRTSRDRDLVMGGNAQGLIEGNVERLHGQTKLMLTLRHQGRRTAMVNQEAVRRQLDFLGWLNVVQFSSLDLELVRGAPEYRRDWVDNLLIQLEPVYAYILQQYQHILRQRNALLKTIRKQSKHHSYQSQDDLSQLQPWNQQLVVMGTRLIRRRSRVMERVEPIARSWHYQISDGKEELTLNYLPSIVAIADDPELIQQTFLAKLAELATAEIAKGTTLVGPHRDEIELTINQTPARAFGSQGQQRTLVLALKLAELNLIGQVVGEPPLLLLDDVLAELDPTRQNLLLAAIKDNFQTLITSTHLNSFDHQWVKDSQILTVNGGRILDV